MTDLPTAEEALRLYRKRDKLVREMEIIDARLNALRQQYMREVSTYGIHPIAFRREIETRRKAA